jgi:polar amino acid transport system permease protein
MSYDFDFSSVLERWPLFLHGAWLTIELSVLATVLGFVIGTLCAIGSRSRIAAVARGCAAYVEVVRNTPLLVQIFLVFFGLSSLGWKVPAIYAAVIALVVNIGAYSGEIMRAGMDAIHYGQIEAAECLALSRVQIYWHVILLPAMEQVYPALTSQFVLLMLASSITSQISVEELTAVANRVQSDTFRSFETYVVVAVGYLVLSLLMRIGFWGLGQLLFARRRMLGTAAP